MRIRHLSNFIGSISVTLDSQLLKILHYYYGLLVQRLQKKQI